MGGYLRFYSTQAGEQDLFSWIGSSPYLDSYLSTQTSISYSGQQQTYSTRQAVEQLLVT